MTNCCAANSRRSRRRDGACALLAVVLAAQVVVAAPRNEAYIWWEGETPVATNFPQETPFSASTFESKRDLLSSGDWLTNAGVRTGPEAYARYEVTVPHGGKYDLWCRKFWKHGPFRWRFDKANWQVCPSSVSLADDTYIRVHLGANWVHLGQVSLASGLRKFELRLLAQKDEGLISAFDCFVLTQTLFEPRGKLKPDEVSGLANPGFFAWEPGVDPFSPEALLDLSDLNERAAGEHGFVGRQGMDFVLGNGTRVRFWAVNASAEIAGLDHTSVHYLAKRLAKLGVNMVRFHSPVFSQDPSRPDQKKLKNIFHLVHALKREGIYTKLSFYFPLWFHIKPGYGVPGYETTENKIPFTLLYFDERMQKIYHTWAKALLTTRNPYTGVPLGREPAVAIVEIINEDSFFFWTFGKKNIPEWYWHRLEFMYGEWLKRRYGSLEKARRGWLQARELGDDLSAGRMTLYGAWQMTRDGLRGAGPGRRKRVGDQVRFLTELQRGFYEKTVERFRKEYGVRNLISPGNWTVSDPVLLDALERYTYTAGEVIDRHGYFGGGGHKGEGASYQVRVGHEFKNLAAVHVPEQVPLQVFQVDQYPCIISELGWTNPNYYRADCPFLAAAYGSLQGIDGIFTFALHGAFWETTMKKFALGTPVIMGSFPAYALLYRRHDVKEADDAVRQVLELDDLYALKGSGGYAVQALDKLRERGILPGAVATGEVNSIDPLAFYVGRVVRAYGLGKGKSTQVNLGTLVDRSKRTIRSLTGELLWDYRNGIVRVDTKRSQGAAGFLTKLKTIELSRVTIESHDDYSTVMVISLDGRPLADSLKILIQVMTGERPYGFRASGGRDGRIHDLGGSPYGVEKIHATITLKLNRGRSPVVTALDPHGYPRNVKVATSGGTGGAPLVIQLQEDSVYHIVSR